QAEDGIRDDLVTGVQTCALPILGGRQKYTQKISTTSGTTRKKSTYARETRTMSRCPLRLPRQPRRPKAVASSSDAATTPNVVTKIGRASCRERERIQRDAMEI